MLKDRVKVNENKFSLYKDEDNSNRQAYYTIFRLADDEINKARGIKVEYWDPGTDKHQDVQSNTYVCIWEVAENNVVEECQVYIRNKNRAKPKISWSIERNTAYGDSAYMIRIRWTSNQSERINSRHLWLENQENGRKYSFLTDYIEPRTKKGEDCYIIENLLDRANVSDLVIRGDDTLLQKYEIVEDKGRKNL